MRKIVKNVILLSILFIIPLSGMQLETFQGHCQTICIKNDTSHTAMVYYTSPDNRATCTVLKQKRKCCIEQKSNSGIITFIIGKKFSIFFPKTNTELDLDIFPYYEKLILQKSKSRSIAVSAIGSLQYLNLSESESQSESDSAEAKHNLASENPLLR
jgi:hypothetical protein